LDGPTGWNPEAEYTVFGLYKEPPVRLSIYSRVRYVGPVNVHEPINPGDVGYVIEDYSDGNYEVEFSGLDGITRALVVITGNDLELAEK
jgi:hypothetical protein